MNAKKNRSDKGKVTTGTAPRAGIFSFLVFVCIFAALVNSCAVKPADMRTLVPAETLVYLEANDLAAALQPIVDSKPFNEVAKSKPDLSALKGVQIAVAVTGFETREEKLTDEHSVGRVQPHFVAVADTHAWNYQAVAFAEKKLGSFVTEIYDSEPTIEKSDKNGGKYFTWSAKDGRKAYAFVIDSIIYFGNDETAIEKCLAVKRGEADSVAKAGKVKPADPGTLASGYVGPDGISQIANIVGLKFAAEAGDDSEIQSAIAGILPQLLRGTVTEITWTSTKSEQGIEDKYQITMPPEIASVFSETIVSGGEIDKSILETIPQEMSGVTIYNLQQPAISWQTLQSVISNKTDSVSARTITALIANDLDGYGIVDPEKLWRSLRSPIMTVKLNDTESVAAVAEVQNLDLLNESLLKWTQVSGTSKSGIHWDGYKGSYRSQIGKFMVFGDIGVVRACSAASKEPERRLGDFLIGDRKLSGAVTTLSIQDIADIDATVRTLSSKEVSTVASKRVILTETRFIKTGMERKTTSDFGLIGSIVAQLAQD